MTLPQRRDELRHCARAFRPVVSCVWVGPQMFVTEEHATCFPREIDEPAVSRRLRISVLTARNRKRGDGALGQVRSCGRAASGHLEYRIDRELDLESKSDPGMP